MSSKNKKREILDHIPFFYPCYMSRIYDILKSYGCKLTYNEIYDLVEEHLYKIGDKYMRVIDYHLFKESDSLTKVDILNGRITCKSASVSTPEQKVIDKIKFAEKYNIPYEGLIELIKEMNL
ncbi:hypothetical protein KQP61_20860 [Bacteroides faecis]|jgi:hypothetical protein|uniref:hypothetical protein n=1 Tax=Bacteroides faecis TaxID=674529 RepID=UPI000D65DEF1|nr:hypothetical protein [Bacteroides faecis]MCS2652608.1 hypothetical protein [Bacteroides faecis]UYU56580.1 hypothetical protein KQP61_20860 [Bacteroides faecis]